MKNHYIIGAKSAKLVLLQPVLCRVGPWLYSIETAKIKVVGVFFMMCFTWWSLNFVHYFSVHDRYKLFLIMLLKVKM